jgi:hypothetical protein
MRRFYPPASGGVKLDTRSTRERMRSVSAAVLGVVGVVLGLVIGSGYQFWAVRRTELATTLLTLTVLAEDLREPGTAQTTLVEHWHEARAALVLHLRPEDLAEVSRAFRRLIDDGDRETFARQTDTLVQLFWGEFSAPIAMPVVDSVLRRTPSHKAKEALRNSASG